MDHNNRRERKHADFFDWFDKPTKEFGIAAEFCQQAARQYGVAYSIADDVPPDLPRDPPDVVLKDGGGALIGLEITELVNGKAIDAQIQGRPDYFATALAFGVSSAIERLSETVHARTGRRSRSTLDTPTTCSSSPAPSPGSRGTTWPAPQPRSAPRRSTPSAG